MATVVLCVASLLCVLAAKPPTLPQFGFATMLSSNMVLQKQPAKAAVYGILGNVTTDPAVTVEVSGTAEYKVTATVVGNSWLAYLTPAADGGNYTITATCTAGCLSENKTVGISNVVFGDVWYCSGQSNMWLPLLHTFSRNITVDNITAGKYDNIRLMAGDSQHHALDAPWMTSKQSIAGFNTSVPEYPLFGFSAACYYFATSLTELFRANGQAPPTMGLIGTAIGGTKIEAWTPNTTLAQCSNYTVGAVDENLFDTYVVPYLNMTVKGFLWYQGENDMGGVHGESAAHTGYGCMMPAMVETWRQHWSAVSGTTPSDAPFGVVTLAKGGSEGHNDMGGMRFAQTANYGVLPNALMPNSFLAQAFDLGDPTPTECYYMKCCQASYNASVCSAQTKGQPQLCDADCTSMMDTGFYMGGIHPRVKKPVGQRLAQGAYNTVYGGTQAFTGPTLSGCSVSGSTLSLRFNTTLLRGESVLVKDYKATAFNQSYLNSMLRVLVNESAWCLQTAYDKDAGQWQCLDEGRTALSRRRLLGHSPSNTFDNEDNWVLVNMVADGNNGISADLSSLPRGTTVYGVRYAWSNVQDSCCGERNPTVEGRLAQCPPASCPIMGEKSDLPANPFMAKIVDGKCDCVLPQVCDA